MRTPSVSVQILGRAVDDNVRAEFDRCTGGRGEGEGEGKGEGDGGGGRLSCAHAFCTAVEAGETECLDVAVDGGNPDLLHVALAGRGMSVMHVRLKDPAGE